MAVEYFWTLPTSGTDRGTAVGAGRPAGSPSAIRDVRAGRYSSFDHLAHLARAVAVTGLDGVVVPFDPEGDDSWVLAAALARHEPTLSFITEFTPAFATPVYAAKMAATFQRFTAGRLRWQLAVEVDPATARAYGDEVTGTDRYQRAAEFAGHHGRPVGPGRPRLPGRFYQVVEGGAAAPLTRFAPPRVYLTGASADALALSARYATTHLWEVGPRAGWAFSAATWTGWPPATAGPCATGPGWVWWPGRPKPRPGPRSAGAGRPTVRGAPRPSTTWCQDPRSGRGSTGSARGRPTAWSAATTRWPTTWPAWPSSARTAWSWPPVPGWKRSTGSPSTWPPGWSPNQASRRPAEVMTRTGAPRTGAHRPGAHPAGAPRRSP